MTFVKLGKCGEICCSYKRRTTTYIILDVFYEGETDSRFSRRRENYLVNREHVSLRESLIKHSSLIKPECDLEP